MDNPKSNLITLMNYLSRYKVVPLISFTRTSGSGTMNFHQLVRQLLWEPEAPSPIIRRKRLRPLAPKLASPGYVAAINANVKASTCSASSVSGKNGAAELQLFTPDDTFYLQAERQQGGTRWNPTQEQIGILEMLYTGGMRTPNAQQIEQITFQLGRYGQIEGKNVFYWFQNHKARERQKHKRSFSNQAPSGTALQEHSHKRKGRSWSYDGTELRRECDTDDNRTLALFPLRPEGRHL